MGEFDFLDKYINEEAEKVDDFFFDEPIGEDFEEPKKRGRPRETNEQKAIKLLKAATSHVSEAMKRLESYRARA